MHCFRFAVLLCVTVAMTVIAVPTPGDDIMKGEGFMLYQMQA